MEAMSRAVRAQDTEETRGDTRVFNPVQPDVVRPVSPGPARANPACRTISECFLVFLDGLGIYTPKPAESRLPNKALMFSICCFD